MYDGVGWRLKGLFKENHDGVDWRLKGVCDTQFGWKVIKGSVEYNGVCWESNKE